MLSQENQELQSKYIEKERAYNRLKTDFEYLEANFTSLEANFHALTNSRSMRLIRLFRAVVFRVRQLKQVPYKLSSEKSRQYLRGIQLSTISLVLANPILKKVARKIANRFPFIMDYSRQLLSGSMIRARSSKDTNLSPLVSKVLLDLKASVKHTN